MLVPQEGMHLAEDQLFVSAFGRLFRPNSAMGVAGS